MSTSLAAAARRGLLCLLCFAGTLALAPEAMAKPYVETTPRRGLHLFTRPRQRNAANQWRYVQALDRAGKTRAASRQALALRLFWPHAPEAPLAQMLHARLLERRRRPREAFDAYQHLIEHYPGRFEFNEVIDRQLEIAKSIMELRKGKFLFLPGFTAPERAIPLLETIVTNAPEWPGTAEALFLIGQANERIYEYAAAIDAYFTTLNRFPDSPFAEQAAYAQVQSHIKISRDAPRDNRALETAFAACDFFLQRFPASRQRGDIESARAGLREQQADNAFARARYYDRILRNPTSALIEYRSFLARFPNAPQAAEAQRRIESLTRSETKAARSPDRKAERNARDKTKEPRKTERAEKRLEQIEARAETKVAGPAPDQPTRAEAKRQARDQRRAGREEIRVIKLDARAEARAEAAAGKLEKREQAGARKQAKALRQADREERRVSRREARAEARIQRRETAAEKKAAVKIRRAERKRLQAERRAESSPNPTGESE